MEDQPSENPYPSQQPPPQRLPPKPTTPSRGITIERSGSFSCRSNTETKDPNENPGSTVSSKTVLEEKQTVYIKPPPPPTPTSPLPISPDPIPIVASPSTAQECSYPTGNEKVQSAVSAHKEAVKTLKFAVKDFVTKAITSTQEAITIISKESNKHIETIKKTASGIICDGEEKPKSDSPAKKVSNIFSERKVSWFNVVSVKRSDLTDGASATSHLSHTDTQINKTISFLVKNVDSALSVVSDTLCYKLRPRSFNDQSSKYDVPLPRPKECSSPEELENSSWHPGNFHLFSKVKDKVWALFTKDDKTNIPSKMSSTTTLASETEEDFTTPKKTPE